MTDDEFEESNFKKKSLKKVINTYNEEIDELKAIVTHSKNSKSILDRNSN